MFQYDAFGDDATSLGGGLQRPFFTVNIDNTDEVLSWLWTEINNQQQRWQDDYFEMRQNVMRYEGRFYNEPDQRLNRQRGNYLRQNPFARKYNKITVNHLRDFTEARCSRLLKFDPNVLVTPNTNEYEDDVDARVADKILKAKWEEESVVSKMIPLAVKMADITGEGYIFTDWNPFKGPKHPSVKELPEDQVVLSETDKNGEAKDIKALSVRVGDVEHKVKLPFHVFLHAVKDWNEVDFIMHYERQSVDTLKFDYPNYEGNLVADSQTWDWEDDPIQVKNMNNEATVFTFYHRCTSQLPEGRKIVFTKGAVLESVPFPFKSEDLPGPLPVTRFMSDEVPGRLRGVSIYRSLKPLNDHLNTLTTMIVRGQVIAAHPKWLVPQGSAKLENLGNDITIVQYKGAVPPQLAQFSPNSPELFNFREQMKEDLQLLAGVGGTSRGEPPPGIKAGVALQFLVEQENEKFTMQVKSFQASVKDLAAKTLLVIGNRYQDGDERIVRAVGSNTGMDQEIVDFKASQLQKKYNIQIQNSSALPESKAARIQNILDLQERFPQQFDPQTTLSMIGMASGEKFIDAASIAIRAAQSENERLLGEGVANPESGYEPVAGPDISPVEWEDHFLHWKTHTARMQELRFKLLPLEVQMRVRNHVMAHEMLMLEKSKESNAYAEACAALPAWPIFFKVAASPTVPPIPGQADPAMMEATSAAIPADPSMQLAGPEPSQPSGGAI